MNDKLKFGSGNSKLAPNIFTFSLPAGYSCPGASNCLSKAVKQPAGNFKLVDGPKTEIRCFAAIDEALKPAVRLARWHNFNVLKSAKTTEAMASLIQDSLPTVRWKYIIRIHVSGDFFSQAYFDAWMTVARNNPKTLFYAYTKSLAFWSNRLDSIPDNMKLTASGGGKWDKLINQNNFRWARVVLSEGEAEALGLEIDHDDSHAYEGNDNFALLLHGTQPAGSAAAFAWAELKKIGKAGYHNHKRGRGWGGKDYNKKKNAGVLSPVAVAA